MTKRIIFNGDIANEGKCFRGYIVINDEFIETVAEGEPSAALLSECDERNDVDGALVMPGVIDDQVHFRDPGLTWKADLATESAAAVAGGVTSFMDMPNTNPPTVSLDALEAKNRRASEVSVANYGFFVGATNDNINTLLSVDYRYTPGVKVFLGASTGNMLVNDRNTLKAIFSNVPAIIAIHSEDEALIRRNKDFYQKKYGSTARELELFENIPLEQKRITAEACVHHLWFTDGDYAKYGNLIKWNPAVKTWEDRAALRAALTSGYVDIVATDHAPHLLSEKQGNCLTAASGGPLVQHSLQAMLELERRNVFALDTVVEKMCHAPATLYGIVKRGFLRAGYYADVVVVDRNMPFTVRTENILSKCGWSPFEGVTFHDTVRQTYVNGHLAFDQGVVNRDVRGSRLRYDKTIKR